MVDACNKIERALPGDDHLLLSVLNWGPSSPDSEKWKKLGLTSTLQTEVLGDVLPIIAPERNLVRAEVQLLLTRLVTKINAMDLRPQWQVAEFEEGDPWPVNGGVVEVQGHSWIVIRHMQVSPRPKEQFLRRLVYSLVALALESATLTDLRKCKTCNRIFVMVDPRRKFCSVACRTRFNNDRRLKEGYFSNLRRRKRTRALSRSRKHSIV